MEEMGLTEQQELEEEEEEEKRAKGSYAEGPYAEPSGPNPAYMLWVQKASTQLNWHDPSISMQEIVHSPLFQS